MCYVSPVINVLWRHDTPSDQLQLLHWSIERDSQVDLIGAIMFYCLGLLCLNLTHSLEQMHLCQEQSSINTNATSLSVLITSMTQCTCVQDQTIPSYKARKTFYNSYILPHMDYCSTLWGNATTSDRIYQLQRHAARIITDSESRAPSDPLLEQLNWLPLVERVKYRQSQLVYKAVNGLAPDYMCALFTPISNISTRTTRSNIGGDLYVPKAWTNVFKNSIAVNGAHIWNELDPIIRNSNSLSAFKTFLTRK